MVKVSISTYDGRSPDGYLLGSLFPDWQALGLEVTAGHSFDADADLCILHHDMTKTDPAAVPEAPRGARVVNGRVLDISKRLYSTLRLERGDDWSGPVIVKSDLNHYGIREEILCDPTPPAKWRVALADRGWWRIAGRLPDRTYPVLGSIREVPRWVWRSSRHIVERFMPEREGDLYCLRGWIFLGSADYGYRIFATDPMVKTDFMVSYEYRDDVPPELRAERERMGFDFGKFDYVVHDGRAHLLDANKTPWLATRGPKIAVLAQGIRDFLP